MVLSIALGILLAIFLLIFIPFVLWVLYNLVLNYLIEKLDSKEKEKENKELEIKSQKVNFILKDITTLVPEKDISVLKESLEIKNIDLEELKKQIDFLKGIKKGIYDKIYLDSHFSYFNRDYLNLFR